MRQFDETDAPKSESEQRFDSLRYRVDKLNELLTAKIDGLDDDIATTRATYRLAREAQTRRLEAKIEELEKRVANLETQRTPQDENDDPEWF